MHFHLSQVRIYKTRKSEAKKALYANKCPFNSLLTPL